MLKAWLITWKKRKTVLTSLISILGLAIVFLTTTGFVQSDLVDNAHIVNKETETLIHEKNARYQQTKEQPQIVVITEKRLNKLTPKNLNSSKRTAFIVVGQKGKKRNVQIYSSKDLHAAFTADSRMNIIRAAGDELRSKNNATFNKGLRFVFRACATRIDQQYQYSLDKYDLTNEEQDKISHPRKVALPIAFALVVLVSGLIILFKSIKRKQ